MRNGKALLKSTVMLFALMLVSRICKADERDGIYLGVSALVESGPPEQKTNVIFLGDGFTESQQDFFNSRVDIMCQHLFSRHPFNALMCAFNIYRINVASAESGIDVPSSCAPIVTGQERRTAMNASYCSFNIDRCIYGNNQLVKHWIDQAGVANMDDPNVFVYVIVNDTKHGGCSSGNLAFGCIEDGFERVFIHEFGHALSGLADEYVENPPRVYQGGEPQRVDITLATRKEDLKWRDLVLSSTPIPTKHFEDDQNDAFDIVGTFEGANYAEKNVFRPCTKCTMRDHADEFCSVCRRKIISDLQPYLCSPLTVTFTDLLIRDDEDPWPRGAGEIYFNYDAQGGSIGYSGRWPGNDGEVDFDDGDLKSLNNYFVGTIPNDGGIGLRLRFRENDWPDGDDGLSDDYDGMNAVPGPFTIDKPDYRLRGNTIESQLKVLLDMINIKDGGDWVGDGDIYIKYTITSGANTISGRWPRGDEYVNIGDGETSNIGSFAAAVPLPPDGSNFSIHVEIWDEDGFLNFGDDLIGSDNFFFTSADHFGADPVVHIEDKHNYRLTYSLVM